MIGLPSGILLFFLVIVSQFTAIVMYDDFTEKKNHRLDLNGEPATISIQNKNFLSLEIYKPFFLIDLRIINHTGEVGCFMDYSKDKSCESHRWDMNKIESGDSASLSFYLYPNGNNFTIQATPYLNFNNNAVPIPFSTNSWYCQYTQDDYYWCIKNRN